MEIFRVEENIYYAPNITKLRKRTSMRAVNIYDQFQISTFHKPECR